MSRTIHSVAMATLCTLPTLVAQPAQPDLGRHLDALAARYHAAGLFNGNVLVARQGKVLLDQGYGLASFEQRIPNGASTKHWLASVSKVFTATTVMRLVDQGRLSLDGKVSDLLPWYRTDTGCRITVRMLLNHTSGLPDYLHLPGRGRQDFRKEAGDDPIDVKAFVRRWCSADLAWEPGTQWGYSNSGYVLLGAIVEAVTDQPFARALQQLVLEPAGMRETLDLAADPHRVVEGLTPGYQKVGDRVVTRRSWNLSTAFAAGAMVGPLGDLLKFNQVLDRPDFLSPAAQAAMFTPGHGNWGCGWEVRALPVGPDRASRTVVGHEGFIFWSLARIYRLPEEDTFVAVVNNTGDAPVERLFTGLMDVLHGRMPERPNPPVARPLRAALAAGGLEAMLARHKALRATEPEAWDFSEPRMNAFGYELLQAGQADAAVAVFRLNAEAYPTSGNAWDSLGEGLAATGKKQEAILAYRKALELAPGNRGAAEMLIKLGGR